jgi:hypothetical protein
LGKYRDTKIMETHSNEGVKLSKKCTSCKEIKLLDDFSNSKNGLGGKHSKCKECMHEFMKKYNKTSKTQNKVHIQNGESVKKCIDCGEIKNTSEFHRHGKGFISQCKPCRSFAQRKGTGPEVINIEIVNGVESKKCRSCEITKPFDDFHSSQKGLGGKRSRCIDCERLKGKEYRLKNRENRVAASKRWRLLNPIKQKESKANWRRNNKQKDKVYQNNRKVAEMSLRNDLTVTEWQGILADFGGRCALSGVTNRVTMDHFIPISTGFGGTYVGNVYPLSLFLNTSKHNRNPFDWYELYGVEHGIKYEDWSNLIHYLADQNNMTAGDFKSYVNECFCDSTVVVEGGEEVE